VSGDNVLIGARGDNTAGSKVGQAHLFTMASAGSGSQVPEPATLPLVAAGLVGLAVLRRRRNRTA